MRVVLSVIGIGWLSFAILFVLALTRAARKQAIQAPTFAGEKEAVSLEEAA